MPPLLMLIGIAFVVLMVMFGNNPLDQWRIEEEKYGKDPLERQINKFNEERMKKGTGTVVTKYKPPPGSTVYYLPPDQAPIPPRNLFNTPNMGEDELVHPAPDVPIDQWNNPYPSYMYAPRGDAGSNTGYTPPGSGTAVGRAPGTGTSLVPGSPQR